MNKEQKKKQKEAYKDLGPILKKIKKAKKKIKKVEQALELINELESSLDKYGKYLPKKEYDKLKAVIEVSKSSLKGVKAASTGLEVTSAVMELHGPLQAVVALLPGGFIIGTTATAVTIIVVILVVATGSVAAYNNYTAVEIIITNDGCQTIPILLAELTPYFEEFDILFKIMGIELPQEVTKDTSKTAKLRPEIIEVDGTTTSIISVKTDLGEFPISIPTQTTSVKFNDMQILGQKRTIDLGESPTHQLVISCT